MIRSVDPWTREYARDYANGWAVSARAAEGALDRADDRDVSHAWYDGYSDHACGRERWTYRAWRRKGCGPDCADVCWRRPAPGALVADAAVGGLTVAQGARYGAGTRRSSQLHKGERNRA